MFWTVARKEIISNLLSYKFFIVILLTILLISTSFFIMHKDYKERLSDYHIIKPGSDEPIAVIPPNPLSIFSKGLEENMTRSFEISVISITARSGQKSGNLLFSFFSVPDFLYIVKVVLSLVALLFGFDQVSRERERGTLKLIFANPISRAKVLFGKWMGNFLCVSVPFLLVTLIGIGIFNLDTDIRFSSGNLIRMAVIIFISLVYIAFFLSLGIFISALTKKAATSVVILLFVWALVVFVMPNLGTLLARQFVDVPSVKALSEKRQQTWTREVLLGIADRKTGISSWEDRYKTIYSDMDKLEEDYRNKFNRLVRLSKDINRISPVASFIYAVTEIAGTGIGEESNLKRAVVSYKNSIFSDVISANLQHEKKEYPAFIYHRRSLSRVFADGALFDAAWMIFFNVIFFVLSYFIFVKYDVR